MADRLVDTVSVNLTPNTNGGETLSFIVEFYDNGDNELYMHQRIELQSYCNSASLNLFAGGVTPALLREVANKIEVVLLKHK